MSLAVWIVSVQSTATLRAWESLGPDFARLASQYGDLVSRIQETKDVLRRVNE